MEENLDILATAAIVASSNTKSMEERMKERLTKMKLIISERQRMRQFIINSGKEINKYNKIYVKAIKKYNKELIIFETKFLNCEDTTSNRETLEILLSNVKSSHKNLIDYRDKSHAEIKELRKEMHIYD